MKTLRDMVAALTLALMAMHSVAAPGEFDATFAGNGQLPRPFSSVAAIRVMPDGRFMALEWFSVAVTPNQLRVGRWLANGQPDGTWGANGEAVVDTSRFLTAQGRTGCTGVRGNSLNAAPDGSATAALMISCNGADLQLAVKLRANGAIDTNFGSGGFVDLNKTGLGVFATGLLNAPEADGSVLVATYLSDDFSEYVTGLQRLRSDGTVATTTKVDMGYFDNGRRARFRTLSDGRILGVDGAEIRRFSANGSIDASFGNAGSVALEAAGDFGKAVLAAAGVSGAAADVQVHDAVLNADGSVVFALLATATNITKILVARTTPAGQLDSSFGTGGVVQADFTGTQWTGRSLDSVRNLDLVSAPTGEITVGVLATATNPHQAEVWLTAIWRLTAAGQPPQNAALRGTQILSEELGSPTVLTGVIGAQPGFSLLMSGLTSLLRLDGNDAASPGMVTVTNAAPTDEGKVLHIPVMRAAGSSGALSVNYTTAAMNIFSPAIAGNDYVAVSGHLDWAAGESGVKYIAVTILGDALTEAEERFAVDLTPVSGAAPLVGSGSRITVIISANSAPIETNPPPAPSPVASSGGSGGGALRPWFLLLLVAALAARGAARRRAKE